MQNEPNFDNVDKTPTSAQSWRGDRSGGPVPVSVPSGNVALCRRPGMEVFMRLGMIPNSLMSVVSKQITKAQKGQEMAEAELAKELDKIAQDQSKLADILTFADAIVCFIVIEPKVHPTPDEDVARDPRNLYVDEVDMQDKMYLMQWAVGGTESLEQFRRESGEGVGVESDGESVVNST